MSILAAGLYIGLLLVAPLFNWNSHFGAVRFAGLVHDAADSHRIIVTQLHTRFYSKRHAIITSNHHWVSMLISSTRTCKISDKTLHTSTSNNIGHHGISPSKDSDETAPFISRKFERKASKVSNRSERTNTSML